MPKLMTLCIIHQHPKVLLGMKKRGFGAGRWNGFGGKVQEGESIEESMRREMREEAGVELKNLAKAGIVDFEFEDSSDPVQVHFFKTDNFAGEPTESEEMKPEWFFIDEIPFAQMWPDDVHWMPFFLSGKKFRGKFLLDHPSTPTYQSVILQKEIEEVENI